MIISKDGTIRVSGKSGQGGGTSIVYLSGTTGGAVCTLGYFDDFNTFIPLVDGLLAVDTQTQVDHGYNWPIVVRITGASGTTQLSLIINGKA